MGLVLARTKDKGLLLFVDMLVCAIGLFLWFNLDIGVVGTYVIAFVLGCFLGAAPTVFFAMAPEVARSPKTVGAATAVVVLGQNGGTLAVPDRWHDPRQRRLRSGGYDHGRAIPSGVRDLPSRVPPHLQ